MPENFPRRDPDTGDLVDVPHFDVAELATRLHVSMSHVRRMCATPYPAWPHRRIASHLWFDPEHVERIMELSTVDPDAIPDGSGPARLGTPLSDDDLEGVR